MQAPLSRTRAEQAVDLPAAVLSVLARIPDPQFRERLTGVLKAATRAIMRLRDLDLTRIEQLATTQEGSDLAMWEEVAPAVGASISDVNALLAAIDDAFPEAETQSSGDDIDLAFGPSDSGQPSIPAAVSIPTTQIEKQAAAEKAVQSIAGTLKVEVGHFGKRVRNPSVVADRWNLLIDLQEFRGKCRAAIRELVYSSVSAFADINRAVVVPEYAADLDEALSARHAWITLTRAVGPLNARLQIAGQEQQRPLLLAVHRELDHFRASRGYQRMRAGDKRFVISFARDLDQTLSTRAFGKSAQMLVEGFAKFLDSMAVINRREMLINHDREAFAECGTLLEQASSFLHANEPRRATIRLTQALAVAMRMFGRDRYLDDYLVLRLRWPLENLVDSAVPTALEELRTCLAESGSHAPGTIF
jgi:hypothetical protein